MKKIIVLSMVSLLISGCTTELTSTKNSVAYEYDNGLVSQKDIINKASTHCRKYGKEAELRSRTGSYLNTTTDIFDCK
jgi:uncharacterized protein YceK